MKVKIFSFPFHEPDGFDDAPLQGFIRDKDVLDMANHFFVHGHTPYLTVILSYRDGEHLSRGQDWGRDGPLRSLDGAEREAFEALREWRAQRARQEGLPPYVIATNRQLAGWIRQRAATKADLARTHGFGEAKLAQFGEDILRVLAETLSPMGADPTPRTEDAK